MWALHSFGVISDIEIQSRQAEGQKNRSAFQNFITIEQNWNNQNSKFIGQARIFQFYRKINDLEIVIHEVYPAELNYELNLGRNRWTLGYQSLLLSEGFSLIDTELFHAKNNEISIFSSPEKRNYTTPGISYKFIEKNVSLQIAVFKFDRVEKLSLSQTALIKELFPSFKEPVNQVSNEEQKYDKLIKLMGSNENFDWSTYYCNTYEKHANLQLSSTTNQLEQVSLPFNSFGGGISGLIGSLEG